MQMTTPKLLQMLEAVEGYREKAYDDFQPNVDLNPGDEHLVEGTLTVGIGSTRIYGRPVQLGDRMTRQEAYDEKTKYIVDNIEPALKRIFKVDLAPHQADALGSLIYNFGPHSLAKWRLTNLINSKASPKKIAQEWVTDTYYSKGEKMLGLYRRRVAEVLWYFGLDWRAGLNVDWSDDVLSVLKEMGWKAPMLSMLSIPKPIPKPKKEPAMAGAQIKLPDNWNAMSDDEKATAWLNLQQEAELKNKSTVKVADSPIPVEHIEYLADADKKDVKVKKIKHSQRGKGFAKQEVGKTIGVVAVGGMAAESIGAVEPTIKFVEKYSIGTIGLVFGLMAVLALLYHFYGKWQEQKGRDEADTLLG